MNEFKKKLLTFYINIVVPALAVIAIYTSLVSISQDFKASIKQSIVEAVHELQDEEDKENTE